MWQRNKWKRLQIIHQENAAPKFTDSLINVPQQAFKYACLWNKTEKRYREYIPT